ncbi:MAG: D-alanine--D-alanine ligase [Bacteroidia bacterium]|nr:D-alanine--D-alanine ligase [Bacteroidia bacterium]NNF29851.1 D-alanine--D-alanine ligase [Flavobacteriaceae bacterium]MBT8275758.1 D-alanine--D-alanine ligase [Bacteroidia bacterium]NNJ81484.1 D-alanine--D-alanine ligase [Flavobacteriaceae bacterium]NNK54192.1 D-alanine--D-alanine ligase [Flavobacteriaceae bacterium]
MTKKHIAVAMGGYSSEAEISRQSGEIVCNNLDSEKYKVYPVHILNEGWFYLNDQSEKIRIDRSDFSFKAGGEKIIPDVVFNTIHGTPGEDGYMAAYWDLLGIRQTSSGFYPAALSFNKRDCLSVLKHFGIHCANSYYVNQGTDYDLETIVKTTGLPCFVKPNRAGSSFGISKVHDMEDLQPAIEKAFKEDPEIIIETALNGTEVSVGAFRKQGEIIILPPTEIVSENDFFDYEAKYLGKSQEITPARISDEETVAVQLEAKRIYHLLNMNGVTRSDFIIQDGVPFFIETNTTPGLSSESIVPKMAREAGMTLTEFFGILVEEALAKK